VRCRGGAGGGIRARELGRAAHRVGQGRGVERVDENPRFGWDELRRPAYARGDDRPAGGHAFEERLPERLDQGGLAEDGRR
jgi:hypothetical protein